MVIVGEEPGDIEEVLHMVRPPPPDAEGFVPKQGQCVRTNDDERLPSAHPVGDRLEEDVPVVSQVVEEIGRPTFVPQPIPQSEWSVLRLPVLVSVSGRADQEEIALACLGVEPLYPRRVSGVISCPLQEPSTNTSRNFSSRVARYITPASCAFWASYDGSKSPRSRNSSFVASVLSRISRRASRRSVRAFRPRADWTRWTSLEVVGSCPDKSPHPLAHLRSISSAESLTKKLNVSRISLAEVPRRSLCLMNGRRISSDGIGARSPDRHHSVGGLKAPNPNRLGADYAFEVMGSKWNCIAVVKVERRALFVIVVRAHVEPLRTP